MKHFITFITATVAIVALGFTGASGWNSQAHAAEAEYYVWVDENGVTNYSQRSPQGIEATYIGPQQRNNSGRPGRRPGQIDDSAPDRVQSNPTREADPDASPGAEIDPDELIAEERAAIAAKISETKRENCEIGKQNLAQLTAFSRIRVNDGGQERVLSEDERQARIQEARNVIRENCQG